MESQVTLKEGIQKSLKTITIIGIATLILGIIALIYPEAFGKASVAAIGVLMIIGGILRLVFAAATYSMGSMFMRYLYAILMTVAGIYIVANPDIGLKALTMVLAIYFIIDGITAIVYSFSLMPLGGGMYLLFSGGLSLLIGILIFSNWPEASNYVIGIYVGVKLLGDGIMLALTGHSFKKSIETV
jgi:uncharacterized membrane protein HdeD (DUF308 family)